MDEYKEIEVEAMEDPRLSLEEWKTRIEAMIRMFGNGAIMYADGGYNNVTMKVITKANITITSKNT